MYCGTGLKAFDDKVEKVSGSNHYEMHIVVLVLRQSLRKRMDNLFRSITNEETQNPVMSCTALCGHCGLVCKYGVNILLWGSISTGSMGQIY